MRAARGNYSWPRERESAADELGWCGSLESSVRRNFFGQNMCGFSRIVKLAPGFFSLIIEAGNLLGSGEHVLGRFIKCRERYSAGVSLVIYKVSRENARQLIREKL